MGEWKELKWGNIATLEYGKGLQGYDRVDGKYPVFGTNGKIGTTNDFLCPSASVVIGRKGAYRGVHFADGPFYVIDTAFYLKPRNDELDIKYAYYQLLTVDINYMDSGSAIPSTSREDFYDLDIFLPPLPEQRAIAEVLSSLDDKIDLLHRQNQTLEALAETLFRQWFVEDAEEAWEECSLSDIADHVKDSINPSKFGDELVDHYSIPAYDDGRVPKKEPGNSIKSNKFAVKSNTILVSKLNPRFPRIWPVFGTIDETLSVSSTEFQGVRPKDVNTFPFLYYFLRSSDVTNQLIGAAGGTSGSHQRFDPQVLFELDVRVPVGSKSDQFNKLGSQFLIRVKHNQETIRTLTQLRDTLLPKLMSGEIRLSQDLQD